MSGRLFDDLADVYEAMIDWPKRLAHEGPFYRRLFDRVGVGSVVDVACGTGRHAAMFHSWGLRVEGADISPSMIDRARTRFGEPPGLSWAVRGFDEPIPAPSPFDAAVCVGNSLALAPDVATVERAIQAMLAAVRRGGIAVVHLLNLRRLPDGPCVWQKCQRITLSEGEFLVIKGVHRCGLRGYVDLIVTPLPETKGMQTDSVPLLGLEAEQLERAARQGGAARVQCFGDYADGPYDRERSIDLILVAET
ncbi:MAG TPA: class I SAM-dependent methyltransferase [Thermoguttaceae bacterium]|nr:class I SAM-dependent methyltransferase [Thermoguttaceae bacterium]